MINIQLIQEDTEQNSKVHSPLVLLLRGNTCYQFWDVVLSFYCNSSMF
jgi:hypothetical protein